MSTLPTSIPCSRNSRPSQFKSRSATLALALASLVVGTAAPAQAQSTGFSLNRFNVQGGGSDWFTNESIDFRGSGRFALFLLGDYGHKPLVIYDKKDNEVATLVDNQMFLHLGGAVNIADRFRLGLAMPLAVSQSGAKSQVAGTAFSGPDGAAAGDLRASLDIRLIGEHRDAFRLAIGSEVFFPTGAKESYTGDGQVRVAPRLMVAGDAGILAYALRVGFMTRGEIPKTQLQGVGVGNELTGSLALGVRPTESILLGPEIFGSSVVSDGNAFEPRATPLEVLFGGRFTVADDLHIRAGVSPGLTQGLGSPQFRVLVGLEYFPAVPPPDRDGDKVLDVDDACPDVPGRRTRDPKTNGCPAPKDRDKDGILDPQDACPTEPGVRSDDPTKHGCPLPPDRDKDGILDPVDACPDEPGVASDDPKKHGCPLLDRDKDGILDAEDSCVDVPGVRSTDPRTNGCPDRDKDGVFDIEDACPDAPGARDADPKKNGCPIVRVEKGQIRILDQIKFKTGSDVILPESDVILEAVAKILVENPDVKKVRIEGHTDNRGGAAYNKKLSNRRAASVVRWLVTRGSVEAARLNSQGFGMEKPLATNKTEEGRRDNRRVEFHIVEPGQE